MYFKELNLSQEILKAVEELGFTEMTEIQQKSIPLILEGQDVIGHSNTGTGKTAAFGIPAVESITDTGNISVLVMCPTRELAMQAYEEIRKFARYKKGVKAVCVYGGASMDKQIHEIKRRANIVIGTPGRILDHIRRRTLKLNNIRYVVLDEADEMLNMGFREDIEAILSEVPEDRQTVLFSATMPPAILAITETYQKNPVHVEIKSTQKTVELIEQYYYEVAMGRKTDALKLLLKAYAPKSSMVFCNTKKMVDDLTEELVKSGFRAVGIHGDMKQSQRTQVMNSFRNKSVEILVATDVAARGIDVTGVDAVFNYDLPQDNEYYIHRTGRTGRAGHTGTAYTLISGRRQLYELREIERYTKADIIEKSLPEKSEIISMKKDEIISEIASINETVREADDVLEKLAGAGINYRETALRLISEKLKSETENIPEFEKPRPLKKGRKGTQTVKVDISIGRNKHIAPNFILGALVDATGMSGRDFGKIDIFDTHTTVEIPEAEKDYILDSTNPMKINGNKVEVKLYKGKETKSRRYDNPKKPEFDRKARAYGHRKKNEVYDYIPNRSKRTKKRH
ncbi:MAG: DEAD/DEAH box helicase [Ruminococcus sp.]|nr:DEAD/DEAH box helicase [Ruminococcus sp.]